MTKAKDTVAKGGGSVVLARLLGMLFSFLLFLILARHSADDAGVFRTAVTYIVIAEFLAMLGLHRWLATEIAPEGEHRWPLFFSTNIFTLGVSVVLALSYVAISYGGVYSESLNVALRLAALAVIPSGIFACVQSALLGVGRSHLMGQLNMFENITRCLLCFGLIYANQPVTYIIWVFVAVRWVVALFGFNYLRQMFNGAHWLVDKALLSQVAREAPKFAVIIFAFLLLKNAALLLLPSISSDAETAVFAVAYQLFDLILLIPSVLAITSSSKFADKANNSAVALKRAATQLIAITSLALFPCIALTAAFAHQFIWVLYGDRYPSAGHSLVILMLASGVMMLDQVLSQVMLAKKDYKSDMVSILIGGLSAVLMTLVFARLNGAAGASFALLLAIAFTVLARLKLLGNAFSLKLLLLSVWRPILASGLIYMLCMAAYQLTWLNVVLNAKYMWIIFLPFMLLLYAVFIYFLGGISIAKRHRIKHFLFKH